LIPDPELTEHGRLQCVKLSKEFPYMDKISQIFCSPACRTLETVKYSFQPILESGIQITPWEDIKECGSSCAQKGSSIPALKEKFESLPIVWEYIEGKWPNALLPKEPNLFKRRGERAGLFEKILDRIFKSGQNASRTGLPILEEESPIEILIVSHGGFLQALEDHFEHGNTDPRHKSWGNTTFKSFEIMPRDWVDIFGVPQQYVLIETEHSRATGQVRLANKRQPPDQAPYPLPELVSHLPKADNDNSVAQNLGV
jgi:broad specificity phosphatase PhoE